VSGGGCIIEIGDADYGYLLAAGGYSTVSGVEMASSAAALGNDPVTRTQGGYTQELLGNAVGTVGGKPGLFDVWVGDWVSAGNGWSQSFGTYDNSLQAGSPVGGYAVSTPNAAGPTYPGASSPGIYDRFRYAVGHGALGRFEENYRNVPAWKWGAGAAGLALFGGAFAVDSIGIYSLDYAAINVNAWLAGLTTVATEGEIEDAEQVLLDAIEENNNRVRYSDAAIAQLQELGITPQQIYNALTSRARGGPVILQPEIWGGALMRIGFQYEAVGSAFEIVGIVANRMVHQQSPF
jgi:hypothetical protein